MIGGAVTAAYRQGLIQLVHCEPVWVLHMLRHG